MAKTSAQRQQKRRAKERIGKTITIELTPEEVAILDNHRANANCFDGSKYFYKNALLTGAAFVRNSGGTDKFKSGRK